MATILFKRGNTAQNDAFTGPLGSISIDTQANRIRVHNGVTSGGKAIPNIDDLTALSDALASLAIADISGLQTALDNRILASEKGAVNGVATLDATGKVPATQLPSYVDDVLEFATLAAFPVTGETGKLYIDVAESGVYRWTGSIYFQINASAGSADTAASLAAARTISATGDASWSVSFDGSANVSSALTLSTTGVAAGTYTQVTVDTKGRVTAAAKPTTLSGYGITDATPSSHVGSGGTTHAAATTSVAGFMSAADKTKLNGIATGANNYTLPVATTTVLGGVKQGSGITIDGTGVLSVSITASDIGLGAVPNFALATQPEAETGTSNTTLMSPLRTVQLLEAGNFTLDAGTLA